MAWALTFLFVLVSLVLFRAPDPAYAWLFIKSLAGVTEIILPAQIAGLLAGWLGLPVVAAPFGGFFLYFVGGRDAIVLTLIASGGALALPNSQQVIGEAKASAWLGRIRWSPGTGWAIVTALFAVVSVAMLSKGYQKFVYFGFWAATAATGPV